MPCRGRNREKSKKVKDLRWIPALAGMTSKVKCKSRFLLPQERQIGEANWAFAALMVCAEKRTHCKLVV